ncbi:MAG: protein O-mannosyl-transferase family, partial [Gemmatimonadaceae bacterium]
TVLAGAVTAWLVARETSVRPGAAWGAAAAALCAGLMTTAWANATETEVYAAALLHTVLMLASAARAMDEVPAHDDRWLLCTAYLIALAPAVHLSALVGAPAAIALAARERSGRWHIDRVLLLGGVLVSSAGVGRMSAVLVLLGVAIAAASLAVRRSRGAGSARRVASLASAVGLAGLAATALLIMLVRARHDPPINQGNPVTLAALADVVARRQYDVAGMLPRRAPVWLQLANVAQYADWQIALDWGRGIFTTPARVVATLAYAALAAAGVREMRRDSRRLADALLVLLVCGTLGVAAYLNLKAGASLGAGVIPDDAPHEARERDYFFVLGFWAWGCFCGYGALAIARARRWPPAVAIAAALILLVGNGRTADRAHGPGATAARTFARALLESAPRNAALFVSGDNDTYPLWYAQQVEGVRRDVVLITLPLLPADWYARELAYRIRWRWDDDEPVPGATWRNEQRAALLARAARGMGRPIAASPTLTARERSLLGAGWVLRGPVYVSDSAEVGRTDRASVDTAAALLWMSGGPPRSANGPGLPDDVAAVMLDLLWCPSVALMRPGPAASRDSLEVKCNLR